MFGVGWTGEGRYSLMAWPAFFLSAYPGYRWLRPTIVCCPVWSRCFLLCPSGRKHRWIDRPVPNEWYCFPVWGSLFCRSFLLCLSRFCKGSFCRYRNIFPLEITVLWYSGFPVWYSEGVPEWLSCCPDLPASWYKGWKWPDRKWFGHCSICC